MSYPVFNGSNPAEFAVAITPSDAVALTLPSRSLFIGAAGNLNVKMMDGEPMLFSGLTAGQILPIRASWVLATGTTADGIVALY